MVLLKAYSRYQKLKNGNLQNIIKDITKIYILQVHTYYKYNIIYIVLNIYDMIYIWIQYQNIFEILSLSLKY